MAQQQDQDQNRRGRFGIDWVEILLNSLVALFGDLVLFEHLRRATDRGRPDSRAEPGSIDKAILRIPLQVQFAAKEWNNNLARNHAAAHHRFVRAYSIDDMALILSFRHSGTAQETTEEKAAAERFHAQIMAKTSAEWMRYWDTFIPVAFIDKFKAYFPLTSPDTDHLLERALGGSKQKSTFVFEWSHLVGVIIVIAAGVWLFVPHEFLWDSMWLPVKNSVSPILRIKFLPFRGSLL